MVLAVEERDLHVLDRIAGDRAGAHRLAHALLDGRDEPARDHAALDRVHELEPGAVRRRLDLDVAVGELAAPAGLLLVAGVRLRGALDRLAVGHVRRVELHLGAEALLHPVDDHLDVDLRDPREDLLAGLRVAVEVDRRVLLLEAADRLAHLLLVALRLRLDGERHDRPRHRRQPQRALHVLRGEHVAGVRLLQLGHGADVAGAELVGVVGLLALRHEQLADPLLHVGAAVVHLRVVREHALVDAEQVHAARRTGRRAS